MNGVKVRWWICNYVHFYIFYFDVRNFNQKTLYMRIYIEKKNINECEQDKISLRHTVLFHKQCPDENKSWTHIYLQPLVSIFGNQ